MEPSLEDIVKLATTVRIFERGTEAVKTTPGYEEDGKWEEIQSNYKLDRLTMSKEAGVIFENVREGEPFTAKFIEMKSSYIAAAEAVPGETRFLCSGGFTGCVMQFYHTGKAIFGAHIYVGRDKKGLPELMKSYAEAHDWKLLYEWNSSGVFDVAKGESGFVLADVGKEELAVVSFKLDKTAKATVLENIKAKY